MNSLQKTPDSTEVGELNIPHLKRFWFAILSQRKGQPCPRVNEHELDRLILDTLGLGLGQTIEYLFNYAPSFEHFEAWITQTAGKPDNLITKKLNAYFNHQPYPTQIIEQLETIENIPDVLTEKELSFWEENGYIILKNAISLDACKKAEDAIWERVNADPDNQESWYNNQEKHGIMVELIQHPAFDQNRKNVTIHKAFSQLWKNTDLRVSADRCGFHPPQKKNFPFPGPDLHWDIDFGKELTFGTQGILYLTDTPNNQGALTLVPGFHKKLKAYLKDLPTEQDPQQQDLHALGSKAIGANAGDMIIWNQWLPHGSRPNLNNKPRIVQYINYLPFKEN